jgi:hypothetical protein
MSEEMNQNINNNCKKIVSIEEKIISHVIQHLAQNQNQNTNKSLSQKSIQSTKTYGSCHRINKSDVKVVNNTNNVFECHLNGCGKRFVD